MTGSTVSLALATTLVEFPKLGLKFNIDPSISIFGKEIYWYGIIICFAMILCVFLGLRFSERYLMNKEQIIDYVLCAVPSAIVGARLYYVIFSWRDYKDDLLGIFEIWNGGLAIYGGIIGALLLDRIHPKITRRIFAALVIFSGAVMLLR